GAASCLSWRADLATSEGQAVSLFGPPLRMRGGMVELQTVVSAEWDSTAALTSVRRHWEPTQPTFDSASTRDATKSRSHVTTACLPPACSLLRVQLEVLVVDAAGDGGGGLGAGDALLDQSGDGDARVVAGREGAERAVVLDALAAGFGRAGLAGDGVGRAGECGHRRAVGGVDDVVHRVGEDLQLVGVERDLADLGRLTLVDDIALLIDHVHDQVRLVQRAAGGGRGTG